MKKIYQKPDLKQTSLANGSILCSSSFTSNGDENTGIIPGDEIYDGIFKSNKENSKNSIWE